MTSDVVWDTVGIFVFPGFEPLDAYGPLQLFGSLIRKGPRKAKRVVLVSEKAGPVASWVGPYSTAEYGMDDCPPLDVLVISGGIGTRILMHNDRVLEWIRQQAARPDLRYLVGVCTGTLLLGAAGVLDGREAAATKQLFLYISSLFPAVHWLARARWAHDGKFITSSGIAAGMDAVLHLLEHEFGGQVVENIAEETEYSGHWRDAKDDPYAPSTDQDSDLVR